MIKINEMESRKETVGFEAHYLSHQVKQMVPTSLLLFKILSYRMQQALLMQFWSTNEQIRLFERGRL